ncbi:hypothetical protein [Microvirga sp. KLBC 81]|uniref:hypothetical protein n=1 Tax=Microvirga sp. KLBC 81 TaxID=1862707 RepID=UPI0026D9BD9D
MLPKPSLSFPNAVRSMPGCGETPPNAGPETPLVAAVVESSARVSPAYNLFRSRLESDLFCAIPEDRPVPIFIEAPNWTYAGRADALAQGVFDLEAARTAVRFNGFYLFVALNRRGAEIRQSVRPLASFTDCGPHEAARWEPPISQ